MLEAVASAASGRTGRAALAPHRGATGCGCTTAAPRSRRCSTARRQAEPVAALAAAFHRTIVAVTVALVRTRRRAHRRPRRCACPAGVCRTVSWPRSCSAALDPAGLAGYLNQAVPANDGGISYGQAVVAAARAEAALTGKAVLIEKEGS